MHGFKAQAGVTIRPLQDREKNGPGNTIKIFCFFWSGISFTLQPAFMRRFPPPNTGTGFLKVRSGRFIHHGNNAYPNTQSADRSKFKYRPVFGTEVYKEKKEDRAMVDVKVEYAVVEDIAGAD